MTVDKISEFMRDHLSDLRILVSLSAHTRDRVAAAGGTHKYPNTSCPTTVPAKAMSLR